MLRLTLKYALRSLGRMYVCVGGGAGRRGKALELILQLFLIY